MGIKWELMGACEREGGGGDKKNIPPSFKAAMAGRTSSGPPSLCRPCSQRLPLLVPGAGLPRRCGVPALCLRSKPLTTFTVTSGELCGVVRKGCSRGLWCRVESSSVDGGKSGSSEPVFSWGKLALFAACAGGLYAAGEERLVVVAGWALALCDEEWVCIQGFGLVLLEESGTVFVSCDCNRSEDQIRVCT